MVCSVALFCVLLGAGRGGDDGHPGDPAPDRAAYESAAAQAGKNADAQVRLALWCEAHGLSSQRMKHLALAVACDPNNALARGLMGLVGYQSEWKQPEQLARELDDDPARTARIQEYLKRRAEVRERADDLWKLAVWCEQNGLTQQATAHFLQVLKSPSVARCGVEAPGIQETGRTLGQARTCGGRQGRGRSPAQGEQALEALAGEMAGVHFPAAITPDAMMPSRGWRRSPIRELSRRSGSSSCLGGQESQKTAVQAPGPDRCPGFVAGSRPARLDESIGRSQARGLAVPQKTRPAQTTPPS